MTSLLRRTGNKFLVEINGFGPFQCSVAVESLLEMAFTGQRIAPKIMKNRHRLSNKTEGAMQGTTVRRRSAPRTTTLDLRGLLAKTLEEVSLYHRQNHRIKLNVTVFILDYAQ